MLFKCKRKHPLPWGSGYDGGEGEGQKWGDDIFRNRTCGPTSQHWARLAQRWTCTGACAPVPAPCSCPPGLQVGDPDGNRHLYAVQTGCLNSSSCSGGGWMGTRSALFLPPHQTFATPPQKPCTALEPDRAQETPPPPLRESLDFPLKGRAHVGACFWRGASSIKTPALGCLPSFRFSKGAKASFRKE